MAVAPSAVNNNRLVLGCLQHAVETPIVMCEVVPREIERTRHVTLFEECRGPGVEDECTFVLDRRTAFRKSHSCRRRNLEGRRYDQSRELRVEALLRRSIHNW